MIILLEILKIIFIIIIVILAFILLLVLSLLFTPVFYRIKGNDIKSLNASIRILLGIISLQYDYYNEKKLIIRVLGIKINGLGNKIKKLFKRESKIYNREIKDDIYQDIKSEENNESDKNTSVSMAEYDEEGIDNQSIESSYKTSKKSLFCRFKIKITQVFHSIIKIFKNIKGLISLFYKIKDDEKSCNAIKVFYKHISKVLKHCKPRHGRGEIIYGLEDPAYTGYITAATSAFYCFYGKRITLYPDFEKENLQYKINLGGAFMPIIILWHFLFINFNKDIKNFKKEYL